MFKDLSTFFHSTKGGRKIPRSLKPSITRNITDSLLGHTGSIIAEGKFTDGKHFEISQDRPNQSLWMEIYRQDGSLEEQQSYHPNTRAYSTNITRFDETGRKPLEYTAYSQDGRLVDQIWRDDAGQFQRMAHHYPDLQGIAYDERIYFGTVVQCHSAVERTYRTNEGNIERDEYFGPDQKITHELHYDDETQKIIARVQYQPGTGHYQLVTTYDDKGIKDSEEFYDAKGTRERVVSYYTQDAKNDSEVVRKSESLYKEGVLHTETLFHDDGALRLRTTYESDGKSKASVEHYNSTGEFITERREFHNNKITRKIVMKLNGEESEIKRVVLYDEKGRPYRSREHHRWDTTGDDFWAETDINPKTGLPIASVLPTPTGLVTHAFDDKSGRLKTVTRHREEALGETVEQRTHYHPAKPRKNHPEQDPPLVARRIEDFEIDGDTLHHAREFRVDGSIKSDDQLEQDGSWTRRVFPTGTNQIDGDTPVIFESTRRPDGTLESSTLRAHSDPSILSLQKDYDASGKPTQVHIEYLEGNEDISWEEYTRRRQKEREYSAPANVKLATVSPDIKDMDDGQHHYGRTIITLQGDERSLRRVQGRIMQRFTNATTDLCVGDRQIQQYRSHTGYYLGNDPSLDNHPLIEKVNVLTIAVPFSKREGDSWPTHFAMKDVMQEDASSLRQRGVEEAADTLRSVRRLCSCDIGVTVTPGITGHKDEADKTQFFPYVAIKWANKPYLPAAQVEVISQMVSDDMMSRNYDCTHIPGQSEVDVFASHWSFMPNVANRISLETAREIEHAYVPAALRKYEAEKQL